MQHLNKKTIAKYNRKEMKHFEQTLATCSATYATCATSPDLLLQHQDETTTTYI
jgi:hypothetical protein